MFDRGLYFINVSEADGRALEELLALDHVTAQSLGGAIVDATYAAKNPPLLGRLRQLEIPFVFDPQSVRFATNSYGDVNALRNLPYAPERALTSDASRAELHRLVHRSLAFQAKHDVAAYIAPALPFATPLGAWAETYKHIHELAASAIGQDVPAKPLIALATPSAAVLKSPYALFGRISHLDLAGIYLQPLAFSPKHDSAERLIAYGTFIRCASEYGWRVIAGRIGAFGLVVASVTNARFDSGLGVRESFNLKSLERKRKTDPRGRTSGGRARRVYLHNELTTVDERVARVVLGIGALRGRHVCELEACRFRVEAQLEQNKAHYLHALRSQAVDLAALPTREMRIDFVRKLIEGAVDTANYTNRMLRFRRHDDITTDHLQRWQAALATLSGKRDWRRAS